MPNLNERQTFARISQAEVAYTLDVYAQPLYHDGTTRPQWSELSEIARDSWKRNTTPRTSEYSNV